MTTKAELTEQEEYALADEIKDAIVRILRAVRDGSQPRITATDLLLWLSWWHEQQHAKEEAADANGR